MSASMPQFAQAIAKIQENAGPQFQSQPDYIFEDQSYPLFLSFASEQNKKTIIGTRSKQVVRSWEYCLVDTVPYVGERELQAYFALCQRLCAQLVQRDDPCHAFTYCSLIVLTEELDSAQRKILKKFHEEIDYRFTEGYGWSSLRIAVVDRKNRKIFTNSYGADLKKRLTGLF